MLQHSGLIQEKSIHVVTCYSGTSIVTCVDFIDPVPELWWWWWWPMKIKTWLATYKLEHHHLTQWIFWTYFHKTFAQQSQYHLELSEFIRLMVILQLFKKADHKTVLFKIIRLISSSHNSIRLSLNYQILYSHSLFFKLGEEMSDI